MSAVANTEWCMVICWYIPGLFGASECPAAMLEMTISVDGHGSWYAGWREAHYGSLHDTTMGPASPDGHGDTGNGVTDPPEHHHNNIIVRTINHQNNEGERERVA